ncbi:MAG: sigma-70 family RNA polymerase sigma factor [Acidimicrobiales bacterium]|nr:sigma-70 family RNA polymerase sigma factor [Acidimicrobiales bacterium]
MNADLLAMAQAGNQDAFAQLVDPYQRELQMHCYRILGSLQDAEDTLQETLLAAWQSLPTFEERASLRTWLYRIATNRSLNAIRSARRRPRADPPMLEVTPPEPTSYGEVLWLEPYPDALMEGIADVQGGPEARIEAQEAISLAFVAALQLLPPRQRAVLVLRDVLGYHAAEVARMLETTEESVSSALKRARTTLRRELPEEPETGMPPPGSPKEQDLASRLARAFETSDVAGLVTLLTEDAWLRMPPMPFEYQGRELAGSFLSLVAFREGRRFRMVPTRANGQPAFGVYSVDQATGVAHAIGILVLTLRADSISALTRFDSGLLSRFGLPRTLMSSRR